MVGGRRVCPHTPSSATFSQETEKRESILLNHVSCAMQMSPPKTPERPSKTPVCPPAPKKPKSTMRRSIPHDIIVDMQKRLNAELEKDTPAASK